MEIWARGAPVGATTSATGAVSPAVGLSLEALPSFALQPAQTQSLNLIFPLMALSGRSVTRQTLQGGYR